MTKRHEENNNYEGGLKINYILHVVGKKHQTHSIPLPPSFSKHNYILIYTANQQPTLKKEVGSNSETSAISLPPPPRSSTT
jgi:hypothetical protein